MFSVTTSKIIISMCMFQSCLLNITNFYIPQCWRFHSQIDVRLGQSSSCTYLKRVSCNTMPATSCNPLVPCYYYQIRTQLPIFIAYIFISVHRTSTFVTRKCESRIRVLLQNIRSLLFDLTTVRNCTQLWV